jgi:arylformamidase
MIAPASPSNAPRAARPHAGRPSRRQEVPVDQRVARPAAAGLDPARLDREYDMRNRHPDWADIVGRWAQASALVRDSTSRRLGVHYGDGPDETLDIYPTTQRNAPVLIYLHGGYWRSLDAATHAFLAPSFVADGAMVVVPDYSLCPAVTIEQIALQVTRAIAWTWRNAARYGGDPARIAVVGHSAGGHLATMMLSCRWKDVDPAMPAQPLSGAMSISGLYDLEPFRHAPFLRDDLRLTPASVRRLSPAFFPRPRRPLYVVAGGDETTEFLRQNLLIREQWGPTSVPVCETLSGANHFTVLHNLADPKGRLHDLALRLLDLR